MPLSTPAGATQSGSSVAGSLPLIFRGLWSLGDWACRLEWLRRMENRDPQRASRRRPKQLTFRITEGISSGVDVLSFSAPWAMSSRRSPTLTGLALPHLPHRPLSEREVDGCHDGASSGRIILSLCISPTLVCNLSFECLRV